MPPELTLVLCTYNEAGQIVPVLEEARAALQGIDHEILVVDDNSPDGTAHVAQTYARTHPEVRVIVRTHDKGLSPSQMDGIQQARSDLVAFMDADGQHPPQLLPRMLAVAREHALDLVVGSRFAPGGDAAGLRPWRRLVSWSARALARLVVPSIRRSVIRDTMTGLFILRRSTVRLDGIRPSGYKLLIDIIARNPTMRAAEVGYVFRNRISGTSKLHLSTQTEYVTHLARLAWNDPDNRALAQFAFVGATGTLVNLAILALVADVFGWASRWQLHTRGETFLLGSIAAAAVARIAAAFWTFAWNDTLTFRALRGGSQRWTTRFLRFSLVGEASFLLYLAIYGLLVQVAVPYLVAAITAILLCFPLNYMAARRWAYAQRRAPPAAPSDATT